jgi:hypothetical protein
MISLAAALMCVAVPVAASAATYYVSPGGNDAAQGDLRSPFATPQRGVDAAKAGDTVIVQPGVYDVGDGIEIFNKSGQRGKPIVFKGEPGAILRDVRRKTAPWFGGIINLRDSQHIIIRGLRLENSAFFGIRGERTSNIVVEDNSSYVSLASAIYFRESTGIKIRRNDVSRFCDLGAYGAGAGCQEGISVASVNGFDIDSNIVHDAPQTAKAGPGGGEGIDAKEASRNGHIRNNRVFNLIQLGIYVDAWDAVAENIQISGNEVRNCAAGIVVASEQGGTARNIRIFNNVVYDNGLAGISLSNAGADGPRDRIAIYHNTIVRNGYAAAKPAWAGSSDWGQGLHISTRNFTNLTIMNNLLFDNSDGQIIPDDPASGARARIAGNLSFPAGKKSWAGEVLGASPIVADPKFVDLKGKNFRLAPGSPAIAASVGGARPKVDFTGASRAATGPLDLGAFAFQPAASGAN